MEWKVEHNSNFILQRRIQEKWLMKGISLMQKKGFLGKFIGKVGTGILFIAACFAAAYILLEFRENYICVGGAAVVLMITGYFFLNALFEDKAKEWSKLAEEIQEESTPSFKNESGQAEGRELKYLEETVKILKEQKELLERELTMLAEQQLKQTTALIKYNKENARQMAVSQRETLELAVRELKKALENNLAGQTNSSDAAVDVEAIALAAAEMAAEKTAHKTNTVVWEEDAPETSDVSDGMDTPGFIDIPNVSDEMEIPDAIGFSNIPDVVETPDRINIPDGMGMDIPDTIDISNIPDVVETSDRMDIPDILGAVDTSEAKNSSEELPSNEASDSDDMMTPDEIARLLEAMGNIEIG